MAAEPAGPWRGTGGVPGEPAGGGGVFADLAGQEAVVAQLRKAANAAARVLAGEPVTAGGMTHAWLFTGPPGSGRSVAARSFAAALLCPGGGCGSPPGGPGAAPLRASRAQPAARCGPGRTPT